MDSQKSLNTFAVWLFDIDLDLLELCVLLIEAFFLDLGRFGTIFGSTEYIFLIES